MGVGDGWGGVGVGVFWCEYVWTYRSKIWHFMPLSADFAQSQGLRLVERKEKKGIYMYTRSTILIFIYILILNDFFSRI